MFASEKKTDDDTDGRPAPSRQTNIYNTSNFQMENIINIIFQQKWAWLFVIEEILKNS